MNNTQEVGLHLNPHLLQLNKEAISTLSDQKAISATAKKLVADYSKPASPLRGVFQTTEQMKTEFVKFLKTIFYQLDEKKVLAAMEDILADPDKTDEEIYKELLTKVQSMKKTFPILSQLWSLFVLKSGMGRQAAELMKNFRQDKFHDYMEIYDRRYVKSIQKVAKLPLDGKIIAVSDTSNVGLADRLQAGSLFSRYPYTTHVPLNDLDCNDPLMQTEKTCKPIGTEEVADNSVDLIANIGGLHHTPVERLEGFVSSLHRTLRPGGVILMRDHHVADKEGAIQLTKKDVHAIATVVHTFVNAAAGVKWEIENREIRNFQSLDEWTALIEKHGFTRISPKHLVLKDDPTENGMIAFVKNPTNLDELRQAAAYRNDCTRAKEGTRATWIEWGNVRFSKQYAEFIQDHHSYAFDFIGHLRQHWQHFYHFVKESMNDKEIKFRDLVFSDNMAMNMFILLTTTIQCSLSTVTSLPSMMMARWKHGENWRNVSNLSALEKFEAKVEEEYSNFIDHTPFYMFDYIGKIKEMWKSVWSAPDHWSVKLSNSVGAFASTFSFLAKGLISAPIRKFYTAETNLEPDTIKILIKDPKNNLDGVIGRWEEEKDAEFEKNCKIEVIYETPDGHKLVSVPRYRPFTKICEYLANEFELELLEVGNQKEISVDVLVEKEQETLDIIGSRVVYEMDRLQDPDGRRYVTYQVPVDRLQLFQRIGALQTIEYIHE